MQGTEHAERSASEEQVELVLVTAPDAEVARELARSLVEARLAACVNVVPGLRSIYRWKGEVLQDDEVLMVLKTTAARYPRLEARLRELHPYDCPEVIALPIEAGHPPYVDWVMQSVQPDSDP